MPSVSSSANGELKLHIGCGATVVHGWINIDKSPNVYLARMPALRRTLARARILTDEQASATFPPGILHADVRKGLHFPKASGSHAYSSHLIEHMSRWQGLAFLRECHRVLRPGGVLRVATPDLADLIDSYRRGEAQHGPTPADSFMHDMFTFRELEESLAQRLIRRLITAPHQWIYDEHSLRLLLEEAGFERIERRDYRDGRMPDLIALEHRPDSLFMEAIRPADGS